jgi:hypothetical protein
MRHARRLIITLIGVTFWCVAATTVAYAEPIPPIPPPGGGAPVAPPPPPPLQVDPSLWKFALVAALAVLMTVAVVGLIASLRRPRPSRPSGVLKA